MTDGDSAEVTDGNSAEDAVWRDLIDRFDAPAFSGDAPAPWPALEDLGRRTTGEDPEALDAAAETPGAETPGAETPGAETPGAEAPGAETPGAEAPGAQEPGAEGNGTAEAGADSRRTAARPHDRPAAAPPAPPPPLSLPGATDADPLEDEHFIPPTPPPLNLDPATKGAWAGLFGGPGYLIVATIAGWPVPGWAAFCAVAAFIAGFTVLVLRMGDDPPKDSGSDDGAVV